MAAPEAARIRLSPKQMVSPPVTVTIGNENTVNAKLSLRMQVLESLTMTEYVVLVPGLTEMDCVVSLVDQNQILPPFTVILAVAPKQMEDGPVKEITGNGFTTTSMESVLEQVFASVTVTLYVVVPAGVTVVEAVDAELLQI